MTDDIYEAMFAVYEYECNSHQKFGRLYGVVDDEDIILCVRSSLAEQFSKEEAESFFEEHLKRNPEKYI
ncbi:hypothetical protein PGH07_05405 [Sulfurovum sp. zt1-1]|uniref:Uncharacterized protein n=1 Tax=Sulfurovum zhangzhouensis TaxID=3019067 RepID=A0ABT7QXV0_9BACT|nr:hypothetical protein [Sulfurovum zhangzhouensis]MDM5271603.1 hypothetical protein [Sulfurovum zhangzhouensis]